MKQEIEMTYCIEGEESFDVGVLFDDDEKFHQFIMMYTNGQWGVIHHTMYYRIPFLPTLSEEEHFQISTVWNVPFDMDFICALQRYVMDDKPNWLTKSIDQGVLEIVLEY